MKKKILILASALLIGGASFVNFGNVSNTSASEVVSTSSSGIYSTKVNKKPYKFNCVFSNEQSCRLRKKGVKCDGTEKGCNDWGELAKILTPIVVVLLS